MSKDRSLKAIPRIVQQELSRPIPTTPTYVTAIRTDVTKLWEAHGWVRPNKEHQARMRIALNQLTD